MSHTRRGRSLSAAAIATAVSLLPMACTSHAPSTEHSATPRPTATVPPAGQTAVPQVRVNQVGYPTVGTKVAYAMLPQRVSAVSFTVAGREGVVFRGRSGRDLGSWNSHYPAVCQLGFSSVARPGSYRITVHAAGTTAVSPAFTIGSPAGLYQRLVNNSVRYFTSERDGADVVPSVLGRQPANLTDQHAYVYRLPRYDSNDNLVGKLHRIGGPVDVAGGWFDAGGGYEKFAYTSSYANGLMLLAARGFPGTYPALAPEAGFGLGWLEKLWNPAGKVLYVQAGIGTGSASNTIQGDYNFWLLPQAEDRMDVRPGGHPGPTAYYVKYRPVFQAAPPGKPISPDLAGRMAADFALGAQLAAGQDRPRAELLQAVREAPAHQVAAPGTVTPGALLADMGAQLRLGEGWAENDPFGLGSELGSSDTTPHAFGLYITDALYRRYGGTDFYRAFADQQLGFALGANPWGSSFVVGAGTTFPQCMQSEVANLAGSLSGHGDIQLGATVDGPSSPDNFVGLGTVSGMRACGAGSYRLFNTKTAAYEDNVVSWPSVEPAIDYTANSLLAFAFAAQDNG
jgi:hypothetical protein